MFTTEHLEGRIQCVINNFVCINLHFRKSVDPDRPFIDQIYININSGIRRISPPCQVTSNCYLDINTFLKEANSIATQVFELLNLLNV